MPMYGHSSLNLKAFHHLQGQWQLAEAVYLPHLVCWDLVLLHALLIVGVHTHTHTHYLPRLVQRGK